MYPNQQKEQYVYDESSNLVSLESQSKLAYSYDATGKVVEKTKRTDKEVQTTAYTYTPSGALIQATSTPSTSSGTDLAGSGSGSLHFAYNKAGNRIEHLQRYNSLNQLIEDDDHLYAYDKRGNLIEKLHKVHKTRTLYTFNLFDQLTKVKRTDKQNRLIEGFTYSYDALNRRVSKTTYTQETLPNGTTHHYLYDDENIVAILDHNKALLATIVHDTQTDTPLSITTYNNEAKPLDDYEKHKLYTKLTDQEKLHIYQSRQQRTYYYHRAPQGHFLLSVRAPSRKYHSTYRQ